jgi:hypothetical protein
MLGWHTKNEVHMASYPRDYVHTTYSGMGNMRNDQSHWNMKDLPFQKVGR